MSPGLALVILHCQGCLPFVDHEEGVADVPWLAMLTLGIASMSLSRTDCAALGN